MINYIKMLLGIITTLLLVGCSSGYQLFQEQNATTDVARGHEKKPDQSIAHGSIEYIILPQDRLEVILYKDPNQESTLVAQSELGQSVNKKGILVNTKGFITLPLIGKVKVAGLTQTQASDKIIRQYKKFINTPSIYLEVLNKRLYVLGEVNKPGVIELDKEKMTLIEAIALAGDLTDAAVRNKIAVLTSGEKGTMRIRYIDLTNFNTLKFNQLVLRPNDIVYVRPNNWKAYKVGSDDFTSVFQTIRNIVAPFLDIKNLRE